MQQQHDIPEYLKKLWQQKRYLDLVVIFRAMADDRNLLFYWRRKYGKAIEGLKAYFTKLTSKRAYGYNTNIPYWDGQIGKYCDRLTARALFADMKDACQKHKPQSIIWFLHTGYGKACRWEMLVRADIEKKLAEQKISDNEAYAGLAKVFGLDVVKKIETIPDWVVKARKREIDLLALLKSSHLNNGRILEIKTELARIQHNLSRQGYRNND